MTDTSASYPPLIGLTEIEAQKRYQQGLGNTIRSGTSRPYSEIFRTNIFNAMNLVLFTIGAVMVAIGRVSEA
ncbi:hypothetical protein ACFLYO_06320, partial [Chloroflexota bacterium]